MQGNDGRSRYGSPKSNVEFKRDVASRPRTTNTVQRSRRSACPAKCRKGVFVIRYCSLSHYSSHDDVLYCTEIGVEERERRLFYNGCSIQAE